MNGGTSCQQRWKMEVALGRSPEEQQATVFAAGCDHFVHKPFQEQAIFDTTAEHLGVRYLYDFDEIIC